MAELAPWPASADGYELQKSIGSGAFAKVWKAHCSVRKVDVAIKVMNLENVQQGFDDIRQEVNVMRLCDHPNVVRCHCSFVNKNELWLIMDYMNKGSCLHVMETARKRGQGGGMREEWVVYILRETLQGLKYFHDNGQIHRDIKAGNILLNGEGHVELADFGVAGWLVGYGARRTTAKTFVGTPCWMAPEVMEQVDGYNQKADIWSLGITALELAKGFAPYAKQLPMKVLLMTIEEDPPSLSTYQDDKQCNGEPFSRPFKEFLRLCLQKDPKKRPTTTTLLGHKIFKNVTKDALVKQLLQEQPNVADQLSKSRHGSASGKEMSSSAAGDDGSNQTLLRGSAEARAADGMAARRVAAERAEGGGGGAGAGDGTGGGGVNGTAADGGEMAAANGEPKVPKVAPPDRPAGTTWVWDDGSSVVMKSDGNTDGEEGEDEIGLDDIEQSINTMGAGEKM